MSRYSMIMTVVAIVLIWILFHQYQNYQDSKIRIESYETLITTFKKEAEQWKDEEGRSRARAEIAESHFEAVADVMPELSKQIEDLKKSQSNLKAFISTKLNTKDTFKVTLYDTIVQTNTSTIYGKRFHYKDYSGDKLWGEFKGFIDETSATINYTVFDSLAFTSYVKDKTLYVEGISQNPNTQIVGLNSISIKIPEKKFRVGPIIGYGVGGKGLTWFVGIGVSYSVIKF